MYFSNPPRPANAPQRTNWKTAFVDLIANPALSERDRGVIESMHQHYQHGRTMTAGRKSYFYLIKERTEAAGVAMAEREATGTTTMGARLKALDSRISDRSSWDAGFVESLVRQEVQGRNLSDSQITTLEKVELRHTDELVIERQAWLRGGYGPTERLRMRLACQYYGRTGYYSTITTRFFNEENYIPSKEQYDKVVTNKYAQKVITAWDAPPKYPAGTLVQVRSTAAQARLRQELPPFSSLRREAVCVVISTTEPIVNAAKGCKRYKVLPVGSTQTYLVEERDVKIHR